eukprot:15361269-Ditylum_brightwellii.AAC.1
MPPDLCVLTSLHVGHGSLGTLQLCREAPLNRATSLESMSHLVEAVMGRANFRVEDHATAVENGRIPRRKKKE